MTSADLTGRIGGYKGVAIRCPGCGEPMRQHNLEEAKAEVDVCDACGGMWVDWFDGEVRVIATETLRTSDPGPAPATTAAGAVAHGKSTTSAATLSPSPSPSPSLSPSPSPSSKDEGRPSRNEAVAIGACPRCHARQLVAERYEVKAEVASARIDDRTSIVAGKTGAELLRCEDCMGSFVSRSSAEVLSWLSSHHDEPPPQSQARPDATKALKPVPWDRFVALMKGLLGLRKDGAAKPDAKKPT